MSAQSTVAAMTGAKLKIHVPSGVTLPNRQGEWPFHPKDPSADKYHPDVFRPNEKYFEYVDFVSVPSIGKESV